ncbi:hypothetical protein EV643_105373 [Kribbella sp. VKM Ac-2527]|uniref:Parallel beta helix pectate lyase-like protein n=1 Tax=Kribbella caucasensis TaxID=2512215 RepID=A0A4R6KIJ9_9ACTN|nr:hypothetical protein [Kribbella sp. VKM Ac-2527]TDO50142.1 hypothetical protein EV643_105373 [Kribbella sp. VKM Ac-2527]
MTTPPLTEGLGRRGLLAAGAGLLATAGLTLPANAKPLSAYSKNDLGPGSTPAEIEAALDAFFDSAEPVLSIPPMNLPISYERQLAHGTRKAIIFEPGAQFYFDTFTAPAFMLYTEPLWTVAVTGITQVDNINLVDDPAHDPASFNTVARVTLSTAQTVRKGDRFRLISDDEVYESLHGGTPPGGAKRARLGEVVTAGLDSTGTTVTFTSPLKETGYQTNVRLCRLADARVDLIGGGCDYNDPAAATNGIHPVVQLEGLTGCRIVGFSSQRSIASVFYLIGCIDTQVIAPTFRNGRLEVSLNHFSYGIEDWSGLGTTVIGPNSLNVRHAVDSGTYAQEANLPGRRTHRHGRTRGLTVSGGTGSAGPNSPTSTHDEADGATVTGYTVFDIYQGASSAGPAFTMRGKNTSLTGCHAANTRVGVYLATYLNGSVKDCDIVDCQTRALMFASGNWQVPLDTHGVVKGSRFSVLNSDSPVWYVNTAAYGASMHGELEDVVLAARSTRQQVYSRVAQFLAPGNWRIRDLTIDLRDLNPATLNGASTGFTGATGIVPFYFQVDGVNLDIENLTILAGRNSITRLLDGAPATLPNTSVRIRNLYYEGDAAITSGGGLSAGNKFGINWSKFTSGRVSVSGRRLWGTGGDKLHGRTNDEYTKFFAQNAVAAVVPDLHGLDDDHVTLRFGGTAGDLTLAGWPTTAMRSAQRVTIMNGSNGVITFPFPAYSIPAGGTATFVLSDNRNPLLESTS